MTPAQTQKRLTALVKRYSSALGLGSWQIMVEFGNIEQTDPAVSCFAQCAATSEYKEATLRFDVVRIIKSKGSLDLVVLHELAHCVNSELEDLCQWLMFDGFRAREEMFRRAKERSATRIERCPWPKA